MRGRRDQRAFRHTRRVARGDIEQQLASLVSVMPENLLDMLTKEEIADLFAFLSLDKPPGDPEAKRLSGAPAPKGK